MPSLLDLELHARLRLIGSRLESPLELCRFKQVVHLKSCVPYLYGDGLIAFVPASYRKFASSNFVIENKKQRDSSIGRNWEHRC